jgi:hypothetical protein
MKNSRDYAPCRPLLFGLYVAFVLIGSRTMLGQQQMSSFQWSQQNSQHALRWYALLPERGEHAVSGLRNIQYGRALELRPLLSQQDFSLMEDRTAIATLWNGSLFIGGSSRTLQRSNFLRIDAVTGESMLLEPEMASIIPGGGFQSEQVQAFAPKVARYEHVFTTDDGFTWFEPTGIRDQSKGFENTLTWLENDTIYIHSLYEGAAYYIDPTTRSLVHAKHRERGLGLRYIFTNGSAVGIRGDESDVLHRVHGDTSWSSVPPLRTPKGDSIRLGRFIYLNSNKFIPYSDKVFFFLDSSLVVTFYSDSTTVSCVTPDCRRGRIGSFRRIGDTLVQFVDEYQRQGIRLQRRLISFDLRTQTATEHAIPAHIIPQMVTRIPSGHVYQTSSGLFVEYDDEPGIVRYAVRMLDEDGAVVQNVGMRTVRARGDRVMGIGADNNVAIASLREFENDRLPIWLPALANHTVFTRLTPQWVNDTTVVHAQVGILRSVTIHSQTDTLRRDSTTAFTIASDGRWYAGMRNLYVRQHGGDWTERTIPSELRHRNSLLSTIHVGPQDIVLAGFRGHSRGSSITEVVDSVMPGGILRSTDDGNIWQRVTLPCDCDWVESITQTTSTDLYAWAANVMLDEAHEYNAAASSTYLIKSTDQGASWNVVHHDEREQWSRDRIGVMQWPIAMSPSGVIAAATQRQILLSFDGGASFTFFDRTPIEGVNALDFTDDGTLWASSWKGLYAMQLPTSSVSLKSPKSNTECTARYDSGSNNIVVRSNHGSISATLDVKLASIDGRSHHSHIMTDSELLIPAASLPIGVYVVAVTAPTGDSWSIPVLVLP